MFNDINRLEDHRRFIRWLTTGKHPALIKGGVGVHANFEEKNGSAPLPTQNAAASLTSRAASALILSNALAIKALPSLSTLPKPRNHKPLNAKYEALRKLWVQWQSNAHAIGNSVYIRGSNIDFWGQIQHDLTEQIKAYFNDFEKPEC